MVINILGAMFMGVFVGFFVFKLSSVRKVFEKSAIKLGLENDEQVNEFLKRLP